MSAAKHNGKSGTVIAELDVNSGRYQVKLSDGAILKIKPANISIDASAGSSLLNDKISNPGDKKDALNDAIF